MHTPHPKLAARQYFLADEEASLALGEALALALEPGSVVTLSGDLGVGKTTVARGILCGLGYCGHVKSPTFTLVEVYNLPTLNLYHFDFYRFATARELDEAGLRDYFTADAICLVEWPERVESLPRADVLIAFEMAHRGRAIEIRANTEVGERCITRLQY